MQEYDDEEQSSSSGEDQDEDQGEEPGENPEEAKPSQTDATYKKAIFNVFQTKHRVPVPSFRAYLDSYNN